MRHAHPLFLAALTALSLSAACAPASEELEDDVGSGEEEIQGGTADTKHTFAVGIKVASGGVCSGVLIAPNLVMTAQHCVSEAKGSAKVDCSTNEFRSKPVDAPNVTVTTDTNMRAAKRTYGVSNVVVPNDRGVCGSDIALLVLDKSVPAKEATPAVPQLRSMTKDKAVTGKIAAIGYGITSKSAKDAGNRRIKESIAIDCVPSGSQDCGKRAESGREFRTEGGVCEGDSGSGAFEQSAVDSDEALVLGVLSRVTYKGETCTEGVYTRTDAYSSLIVAAGVQAWRKVKGTQEEYTPGAWTGLAEADSKDVEVTFASADNALANPLAGSPLGGLFGGIDWSKIITFVKKVVPLILEAVDIEAPREDGNSLPDDWFKSPSDDSTDDDTETDLLAPGNDRETETSTKSTSLSTESDDDADSTESGDPDSTSTKPKKKKKVAEGGCTMTSGPSSTSAGLLLPALGALAMGARRRRRSA